MKIPYIAFSHGKVCEVQVNDKWVTGVILIDKKGDVYVESTEEELSVRICKQGDRYSMDLPIRIENRAAQQCYEGDVLSHEGNEFFVLDRMAKGALVFALQMKLKKGDAALTEAFFIPYEDLKSYQIVRREEEDTEKPQKKKKKKERSFSEEIDGNKYFNKTKINND